MGVASARIHDGRIIMSLTIQAIDNKRTPLGEFLRAELRGSYEFMAASAFLNSGGLDEIKDELRDILESEGRVSIVHGADFTIADPPAIRTLVDMKTRYPQMSYRVHCDWALTHSQKFHTKLYIARKDRRNYCAVIGSSNLTLGGLRDNTEANAVMRGDGSDSPIRDCLRIYDAILASPSLVEPNAEFADKYAALYKRAKKLPLSDEPPPDIESDWDDLMASVRPANTRAPETQLDYAALALARLGGERRYVALRDISDEAERLARSAGEPYKWDTFHNSARRSIYENLVGKGEGLFARRDGTTGQYRLSEKGRVYARGLDV